MVGANARTLAPCPQARSRLMTSSLHPVPSLASQGLIYVLAAEPKAELSSSSQLQTACDNKNPSRGTGTSVTAFLGYLSLRAGRC